jgi:predicted RNA-binding Zn ribbon-like protein
MAGESVASDEGGEQRQIVPAQPGGRASAPGELALVQAFINSHYDFDSGSGADLFPTPAALGEWLTGHGLLDGSTVRVRPAELRRAVALREALRELARGGEQSQPRARPRERDLLARINELGRGASVEVRLEPKRPRFVAGPGAGVDGALGVLLAATASSMLEGSWWRLKICPGEHCGWAFYDHSRNQSGRWCSMNVCGGRAKARAHYRRRGRG